MKASNLCTVPAALLLLSSTAFAADDSLPAPVLEWSIYVLLIFALAVVIGIFAGSGKDRKSETLGDLLGSRSQALYSTGPDCSVTECVRQMNEANIGAMLIMENDTLVGIFTERDAITKVLGTGLNPVSTKVSGVMSHNPIYITPSSTLEEAMTIVSGQRVRHLPVLEDDKVIGMISSGDLTHWLVKDRSVEIRELAEFIGRRRDTR
jgi:CBS domain-containing protein